MKKLFFYIFKSLFFLTLGLIALLFFNDSQYPLAGLGWLAVVVCVVIVFSIFEIYHKHLQRSKHPKEKIPLFKQSVSIKRIALQLGLFIFYLSLVFWLVAHVGNSVMGDFIKGDVPWGR